MKIKTIISVLFYFVSIFMSHAYAASTVQFHGTLMQASCSADAADVDFGDVKIDKTNGSAAFQGLARKDFTVSFSCKGMPVNDIKMRATGIAIESAGSMVDFLCNQYNSDTGSSICFAGSMDGLGVVLSANGLGLIPNLNFDQGGHEISPSSSGLINFSALLATDSTKKYSGGDFDFNITLEMKVP